MTKSLFEIVFNYKHYNIDDAVQDIKELKKMSHEEFLLWQDKKRVDIARHHYENNSVYRKLVGETFPEKWEDLPIVEKKYLQGNLAEYITAPCKVEELYINKTSGSSGEPFVFSKDYYTQARVWSARKIFLEEHNLNYASKQAMFYRKAKGVKNNILEKTKDFILNRYRFSATEVTHENIQRWLMIFKSTKFDYVYGYTSAIVLFSRYLLENNIVLKEICPTLKIVIVTAETCSKEDKVVIEKATGLNVRNEYGSADIGMIAFECENNNFHLVEENVYVETNENNEVLITDMFNISLPLVRYKLGDVATISPEKCICGNHNRYICNFLGRTNDLVVLEDGREVLGYGFYQTIRPILEKDNILKEFFIRQTDFNSFEFDIVSVGVFEDAILAELTKAADNYLGISSKISINYSEVIKRPPTGKLKHFYSSVTKEQLGKNK